MQGKNQPLAVGPALDKTAFTAQSGKRQTASVVDLFSYANGQKRPGNLITGI